MGVLVLEIKSRSKRSRQTFIQQIDTTSSRIARCIAHRSSLKWRGRTWYAYHQMTSPGVRAMRPLNKCTQQFLGNLEVVNCATANGAVNFYIVRLAAQ